MSEEKPVSYWNMEVGSLVRLLRERRTGAEATESRSVPEEATSQEARLRIVPRDGKHLDFYSTLTARRLFSVSASLAGPLAKFSQTEAASGRRVVVTVPAALPSGDRVQIKVNFHLPRSAEPGQDLELTRAGQGRLPPDTRLVEFLFTEAEHEFRYVIELDQRLEVQDFEEVVDRRPVFQSVPPVAQMTAFLRAITHQRRTALTILANLKSAASPAAQEALRVLQKQYRANQELSHPAVRTVHSLLEKDGKIVSQQVLMAFALFLDMETGVLTPEILERGGGVEVSALAILSVAEHFGLALDEATWQESFGSFGEPLAALRERGDESRLSQAMARLRNQRDQRTPIQILEQIANESNSRRAGAFAAALKERLPEGRISLNDEQLALLALLSAAGRKYQPNTLVALCLFVDAEVGFLTEPDIENVSRSAETVDTSMYAMVAVAGAFDVQLRGMVIEESASEPLQESLPALVERAQAGLLAGFREPGKSGLFWRWIRSAEEASFALQTDLEFTRMVLGSFPILDQLSEPDLANLAESGHDLVAIFQSDLDRSLMWRRLGRIGEKEYRSPPVDGRRASFSFLEGFSAYHFSRLVLASLEKVEDEELLGLERVVAVYLDNRENRHYRCIPQVDFPEDLEPPPHSGLVWSHQVVRFPDVSRLPGIMRELGQEALLGRSDSLSAELRTLEWVHESLWQVLTRLPEYQSLAARPDLLERVRKSLWSAQASTVLTGLMDPRTRDDLSKNLKGTTALDFRLYRPMLEGGAGEDQLEFAGLRLMYEMCRSDVVGVEGYFKHYDAGRFRTLIHNRLCEMLDSEEPATRAMALRLLATAEEVPDKSARLVVEYELARGLSDPDPKVGRASAEGLVRLCLMDIVPLPEMVDLVRIALDEEPPPKVDEAQAPAAIPGQDPDELRRVESEIRKWVKDMVVSEPKRAATLPLLDEEGTVREDVLQPLVDLLAGLNTACRADETLSKRRYFCVVRSDELESVRGAVLDSWKVMALSQGRQLAEMVADTPAAELFLDYRFFVEDHAEELKRELGATPYFGGPEQPLTVYQFRPAEPVSLMRRKESSFVSQVLEESRFFLELLDLAVNADPRSLRILRLSSAGGQSLEELESHLPVFTTARSVDPRTAEVFQLQRLRFVPLIHEMAFSREQVGTQEENLADLQALMELFQGKKVKLRSPSISSADELPPAAMDPAPAPPPAPQRVEEEIPPTPVTPVENAEAGAADAAKAAERDRESVRALASALGRAFGLPEELDRQIVNMLMAVGRSSLYHL